MLEAIQEISQDLSIQREIFDGVEKQKKGNQSDTITTEHYCHFCGSTQVVPTGTCFVCRNCGSSEGCS